MGRGREPLSAARIVTAAVALVESEGADAVSMRRLATELGTAPASLYRHVESREELLHLVSEAILAAVELPDDPTVPWQERTALYAYAVRRALARHRGRALFLLGPDSPAPEAFHLYVRGLQLYLDAGFTEELAGAAVQGVVFLVRSFAALEAESSTMLTVPPGSLAAGSTDRFARARGIDGPGAEVPADELFDFLLGTVVDGLEGRLSSG